MFKPIMSWFLLATLAAGPAGAADLPYDRQAGAEAYYGTRALPECEEGSEPIALRCAPHVVVSDNPVDDVQISTSGRHRPYKELFTWTH